MLRVRPAVRARVEITWTINPSLMKEKAVSIIAVSG
jgi:hypothetical protein